jgi:hypothetical protein
VVLGGLVFLASMMLSYVCADARQTGVNLRNWFVLVLFLNAIGFLMYLLYSARRTGNWKRAVVPTA